VGLAVAAIAGCWLSHPVICASQWGCWGIIPGLKRAIETSNVKPSTSDLTEQDWNVKHKQQQCTLW